MAHSSRPAKRIKIESPCVKTEDTPKPVPTTAVPSSGSVVKDEGDLTVEEVEKLGILRKVDPQQKADELIGEGKDGFQYSNGRTGPENLEALFARYTLGQLHCPESRVWPFSKTVDRINGRYQVTLTTCLSERSYVGHDHDLDQAKQQVAESFFRDPAVKELCPRIPPKQEYIRSKVVLYTEEKRKCRAHGVSQEVQNLIVRKRIDHVLEVFHERGYRTDVWDRNC